MNIIEILFTILLIVGCCVAVIAVIISIHAVFNMIKMCRKNKNHKIFNNKMENKLK